VVGDEMQSGFPRKSWNKSLIPWLSILKDSVSNITLDLRWLRLVVQLENMPSDFRISADFLRLFLI
jgi:hypothetical protein